MQDWTRWSGTNHLIDDHVRDLATVAGEVRTGRRHGRHADHPSILLGVRAALGRRIVSFGIAVAGTRVAGTQA
jgi:hypothetical protein